jgi:glutamyl endopeptidase
MTAPLMASRPRACGCDASRSREAEFELESEFEHEYLIIGADSRVLTRATTRAPFRYICNLELSGWAMCSGTLIGPRTVLTAGHCLVSNGTTHNPALLRVIPGRNGSLEPLAATRGSRILLYPRYRANSPTDIGLLYLADAVGNRVGFWTRRHTRRPFDSTGTSMSSRLPQGAGVLPVNLSGYPADMPAARRFDCRAGGACVNSNLRPPRNRLVCGTSQYRSFDRTVALQGGMLTYRNDTCPGHSGSPVWVKRHPSMGGRVLVGVHVGGRTTGNRAVHLTAQHLAWIAANTR